MFVVDNWGCAGTDNITVTVNTTFDNPDEQKQETTSNKLSAHIFPKPSADWVNIQLNNLTTEMQGSIEILDLSGRLMIQENVVFSTAGFFRADVSTWAAGSYFVVIRANGGMFKEMIQVI